MKKIIISMIFLVLLCMSVTAITITDNFNDNEFDVGIWGTENATGGTFVINETNGRVEIEGNLTGAGLCSTGQAWIQSRAVVENNTAGIVSIKFKAIIPPTSTNEHFFFALSNHIGLNSWSSTPEPYCGLAFDMRGDSFRLIRNFPTAGLLSTIGAMDTLEHDLKFVVSRGATTTIMDAYFDNVLIASNSQDAGCANPTFNVSIVACSLENANKLVTFDDFVFIATNAINNTGSGCNVNSDCESGKCSGGFCVLRLGNEDCTKNSHCLSGECTNDKCTKPDFLTLLLTSKDEQFGESEGSDNFISMFFMIGIPLLIIVKVGSLAGALLGGVLYYGLAVFFTIIGMLSPFILIISLFAGLIIIVIAVVLGIGGG